MRVNFTATGNGGGQFRLNYNGSIVANTGVNPPSASSGTLTFAYDATGPSNFTVTKIGSPNVSVDYSFTLTPTGQDGITGDFQTLKSVDGSVVDMQYRSLRADGLGLRPIVLSNVVSSVGQVDAAISEVQGHLGYYGAKHREVTQSRETMARDTLGVVSKSQGVLLNLFA